jgi:heme-degrading monooxygenase HmoA
MTSIRRQKTLKLKAENRGRIGHANRKPREWGYLVMWEFQVRPGMVKRFERMYGSNGGWALLFKQDESYIETELIRDLKAGRTYMTLDFWTSQKAYEAFRKQHVAQYQALDQKCEEMNESEREIGKFIRVPSN